MLLFVAVKVQSLRGQEAVVSHFADQDAEGAWTGIDVGSTMNNFCTSAMTTSMLSQLQEKKNRRFGNVYLGIEIR